MIERGALKEILDIDGPLAEHILASASTYRARKGAMLLWEGETVGRVLLLTEGLVRGFVPDPEGKELTDCLICRPGELLTGLAGFGSASLMNLQALTDCEFLSLDMDVLTAAAQKCPELGRLIIRRLLDALRRQWEEKMRLRRCTAYERVIWLRDTYPDLIDKVPDTYLASYIAMTPVTFSRIKRKLREEKE